MHIFPVTNSYYQVLFPVTNQWNLPRRAEEVTFQKTTFQAYLLKEIQMKHENEIITKHWRNSPCKYKPMQKIINDCLPIITTVKEKLYSPNSTII